MTKAIGQAVRHCREDRGWSQVYLADLVGLSPSAINRKESGSIKIKTPERRKFAEAFGLSLDEFDALWRGRQIERTRGGQGIPVINRAPAGVVQDYEEFGVDSGQGYEYIDADSIPAEISLDELFAVVVVGDSMSPEIMDGDYAVFQHVPIDRADEIDGGETVFVRFAEEADQPGCTLARIFAEDGQVRLQKDNPRYRPIIVPRQHIAQVGVLVEFRRRPGKR